MRVAAAFAAEFPSEPFGAWRAATPSPRDLAWSCPPFGRQATAPRPDRLDWAWPPFGDAEDCAPKPRPQLRAAFDAVLPRPGGGPETATRRRFDS